MQLLTCTSCASCTCCLALAKCAARPAFFGQLIFVTHISYLQYDVSRVTFDWLMVIQAEEELKRVYRSNGALSVEPLGQHPTPKLFVSSWDTIAQVSTVYS